MPNPVELQIKLEAGEISPANMPKPMTDEQLLAAVRTALELHQNDGDKLSADRSENLRRYNMLPYGDEIQGTSAVVSTMVRSGVDSMHRQVLETIMGSETPVEFLPSSDADTEQARVETIFVNDVIMNQNDGFSILDIVAKDGLISKNGFVKVVFDRTQESVRERYEGLSEDKLVEIVNDPSFVVTGQEVVQQVTTVEVMTPMGPMAQQVPVALYNIEGRRTRAASRIKIYNVPPENMAVDEMLSSVDLEDERCRFVAEFMQRSRGELINDGFDYAKVMDIPTSSALSAENQEQQDRYARENLRSGLDYADTSKLSEIVDIYEVYLRIDKDGDGYPELRRVVVAGDGVIMLSDEEAEYFPYIAWTPYPEPHRFWGTSQADLERQPAKIDTVLTRQTLNNVYSANHQKVLVQRDANVDADMFNTPSIFGTVYADNIDGVRPLMVDDRVGSNLAFMQWLDGERQLSTGVGRNSAEISAEALSKASTNYAAVQLVEKSQSRGKYVARQFGNFLRRLALKVHSLAIRYQTQASVLRMGNSYAQVDPRKWVKRENMAVNVGMGNGGKMARLAALEATMAKMEKVIQFQGGRAEGPLLTLSGLHNALEDATRESGLPNPSRYWQDPATAMPPQPSGPSEAAQIAQADLALKAQESARKIAQRDRELDIKEQELALEAYKVGFEMEKSKNGGEK